MIAPQLYVFPLIIVMFGVVGHRLVKAGQLSPRQGRLGAVGLSLALLAALSYGVAGVLRITAFRRLTAAEITEIAFYDESRHHYACAHPSAQIDPDCIELRLTRPAEIAGLVSTFAATRPYSPNHEGPHNRYLLRISRLQGPPLWAMLGQGTRSRSETAWIELYSGPASGLNFGVYTDDPLYRALQPLGLKQWARVRGG